MKVTLVGANLELEQVNRALADPGCRPHLSPEPIAAAYARISRSERSVEELRREARENVDKARKSNRTIVFEMGHASIAEHASFNFDLEGISRLAIEAVEHSRLASYTERSQRYVLIGADIVVPNEVRDASGFGPRYLEAVDVLHQGYRRLVEGLVDHHVRQAGGEASLDKGRRRDIDTAAREDARYLLPLATAGQLGLTLNARSLESMIRRLRGHSLSEIRWISQRLEEEALAVTPSLIRHTTPWEWEEPQEAHPGAFDAVATQLPGSVDPSRSATGSDVASPVRAVLLYSTPSPAGLLLGGIRFERGGTPFSPGGRDSGRDFGAVADAWFSGAGVHAPAPRSFELVDFLFELTCSAACFGQLKRHRMATVLAAPYDPGHGPMVPPSVREAGLEPDFLRILASVRPHLDEARRRLGPAADYLLSNAHCRRVLFKTSLRELVHIARLRLDRHAQWEIRDLAGQMCRLAVERLPEMEPWLCGKDSFPGRS
jgi:flavin-dependent thymidylate synthase